MVMDPAQLQKYEERCIQQRSPACKAACLLNVDTREMLQFVSEGNFSEAFKILRKQIPFPGIIAYACEHPCQAACVREKLGGAICVSDLEKAIVAYGYRSPKIILPPSKAKKIAVVGGGLTGLTAAFELGKKGYPVTVFEAKEILGGALCAVPQDILDRDLAVLAKAKVDIRYGQALSWAEVLALKEQYDAVLLAAGKTFAAVADLPAGVFMGGSILRPQAAHQPLRSLKDGLNAVKAIESYFSGAAYHEAVKMEEPIIPSLAGIEAKPPVKASTDDLYTREEAMAEASRCIRCACLECQKACAYLRHFNEYPGTCIRSFIKNIKIMPDTGLRSFNKMINACSLCGLCGEVCPTDINMADITLSARQMLYEREYLAPAIHDFPIRDMQQADSADAALVKHQKGNSQSKYLFFPGCQLSASRPDLVKKSYAYLKEHVAGGVGIFLFCCGVPAIWSGRLDDAEKAQADLLALWRKMGKPELICACPSCYKTFCEAYPQIKAHFLSEFLDEDDLQKTSLMDKQTLAVHDACSARYEKEIQQDVRALAQKAGFALAELPHTQEKTTCCGYGGLMYHVAPQIMQEAIGERIAESDLPYLTYCINCRDFFRRYGKDAVYWLDLFFGLKPGAFAAPGPDLSLRQENRTRLKRELLTEEWQEAMPREKETMELLIPNEIKEKMEREFILEEDLKETIAHANETGRKAYLPDRNCYVAHYQPKIITYWVEYTEVGPNRYQIVNTYSHRIQLEGEDTLD